MTESTTRRLFEELILEFQWELLALKYVTVATPPYLKSIVRRFFVFAESRYNIMQQPRNTSVFVGNNIARVPSGRSSGAGVQCIGYGNRLP